MAGAFVEATENQAIGTIPHPVLCPDGNPTRPLYFLHIHKTAGTTVGAYLSGLVHPKQCLLAHFWHQVLDRDKSEVTQYALSKGHFGRSFVDLFTSPPAVVTFLREPLHTLRSHWAHVRRSPNLPLNELIGSRTLIEVLRSDLGRRWFRNAQTRALGQDTLPAIREFHAKYGPERGKQYEIDLVRFVQLLETKESDETLLQRAVEFMDQCLFVGLQERLDESMPMLAERLGFYPPATMPLTNAAPIKAYPPLSDEETEVALELTELDRQLYAYGKKRFDEQLREYDAKRHVQRCEKQLAEAAQPLRETRRLEMDRPFWGTDWWPAEMVPGLGYIRWTGPAPVSSLQLPLRLETPTHLHLHVMAVVPPAIPEDVQIHCNGQECALTLRPVKGGVALETHVPAAPDKPWTEIKITCPTRAWQDIHPATHDPGKRGLALHAITFTPLNPSATV